jgi:hypothetical protein
MNIRSNMKHLRKKDPQVSNKNASPMVKVFTWPAGALEVKEHQFANIDEAKEFIGKISSNEVHIKMYNEKRECIHSELRSKGKTSGWLYA